jgi:rubrerythrin
MRLTPLSTDPMSESNVLRLLAEARAAEKSQALFYRTLAAQAEDLGQAALSERLNELHADEQHHLSRLTARLLELGAPLESLDAVRAEPRSLEGWEPVAQPREDEEVRRYESLLTLDLDESTRALLEEILRTERHHAKELGGKWTPA